MMSVLFQPIPIMISMTHFTSRHHPHGSTPVNHPICDCSFFRIPSLALHFSFESFLKISFNDHLAHHIIIIIRRDDPTMIRIPHARKLTFFSVTDRF